MPKLRKQLGESRFGFSEEEELLEHALDELLAAHCNKDSEKLQEAIMSIIHCIINREEANGIPNPF